jgi:O-acetyl-ADP-ribose deacetylase (regulator of RNase III)
MKCLQKANSGGHSSITFPALGTGYHKFPADVASASMVSAFDDFCRQTKNKTVSEIRVVLFAGATDLQQLEKVQLFSIAYLIYCDLITTPSDKIHVMRDT